MQSGVKAVLFDFGGVLIELGGVAPMRAWMTESVSEEALWLRWLASPAVRSFELGELKPIEFASAVCDEFALTVPHSTFLEAFPHFVRLPYPGVMELLDLLKGRVVRASLSNTNSVHWTRVIEEMNFDRHFEYNFPSHLTGRIKPDAHAFTEAAQAMALPPEAILFLNDNQPNVDAARAVGLAAERTVGFASAVEVLAEYGLLTDHEKEELLSLPST